ncbi:MAG: hypothetical protein H0T42_06600 [Deltaproteobacteria bacterium]|nr:hypothetical protein [Deltaproteobacteria bacterium]
MTASSRATLLAIALVAGALLWPRTARAELDLRGAVFVAQGVRFPVAVAEVSPAAPFVPAGVAEVTGAVDVGPERAAVVWLDPLAIVRIRHDANRMPRFMRVVGSGPARARVREPGIASAPGVTYLAQPPGRGDVWIIVADAPATIRVERAIIRSGRMIWEDLQRTLLAWVESGTGPLPAIPISDGSRLLAAELEADATVGAAIERAFPQASIRAGVRAWRKAGVIAGVTATRPFVTPQLAVSTLDLDGMGDDVTVAAPTGAGQPYHHVTAPRTIVVTLEGPGALRVEARAVLPSPDGVTLAPDATVRAPVAITIASRGTALARRALAAGYASTPDALEPSAALPVRTPLVSEEGDHLGDRVAVTIPLFPGRHAYEIVVDGGPIAVRASVARRRARLGEALRGTDDVDRFVRDAKASLEGEQSAGADLVRHLVIRRAGEPRPSSGLPAAALPPLLRLAWLSAASAVDDGGTIAAASSAIGELAAPIDPAAWVVVIALARQLANADDAALLLRRMPGEAPARLVAELVTLLPRPTPIERIRNWQLAAVDLAWRAQPLDPAIAFAERAAWRAGEWALIAPLARDPGVDPPPAQRWLVEARVGGGELPRSWRPGDLWRFTPGRAYSIKALASTVDPMRAAILDVYVATPASEPGPLQLTVDGKPFHAAALSPLERLQIAVAPGAHEVKLDGPAATRAWISQAPPVAVALADLARLQHYWPAHQLRFELPADSSSAPIQISVRALGDKPLKVTLKPDIGSPIEIEIAGGAVDPSAHPVGAAGVVGGEVSFAVRLAPGARVLRFTTSEPERVLAAVAVRRQRSDNAPRMGTAASGDLLERIGAASSTLAADPDDAGALASRASDLLDLGEPALAREDLIRMLRIPARRRATMAHIEEDLFGRLDGFSEPTHLALDALPTGPIVIAPALLAFATEATMSRWRTVMIALRDRKLDEALRLIGASSPKDGDLVGAYLAARAHLGRDDDAAAASELVRIYQRTGERSAALESIDALARVIADRGSAPQGAIAITYGLASRMRGLADHPRSRRALLVAAAQSGWDTMTSMTSSAGQETVVSSEPILPPPPSVIVREALIAPPWPARSGHTLTAGTTAVLDVDAGATTNLRAQVRCVRVLARVQVDASCAFSTRIDQKALRPVSVPLGTVTEIPLGSIAGGRHIIEVTLAASSDGEIASVRFVSDRALAGITENAREEGTFPIRPERRAKMFVANKTAISALLLGKTTLWVQARALVSGPDRPRSVTIVATPTQGDAVRATIPVPADVTTARVDTRRELTVSSAGDAFLVLPDAGPYQVTVSPDRGEIVARLARRDERRGNVPRLPGAWYAAAPAAEAPFELPSIPPLATLEVSDDPGPAPGRVGTWSVDVGARQDGRPDEDLRPERELGRIEGGLAYRRALVPDRAWLSMRAITRTREATAWIAGGAAELTIEELPLGITARAIGTVFTQQFSSGRAWHGRGDLRISRRFAASDTVTVIPGLGFAASALNTTPEVAAVTTEEIDPDVFTSYRYAHDRAATAGLALRWMPLQDMIGSLAASATTNAELGSLDHVDLAVRTQHLVPLPGLGETILDLGYRPSYRLADDDRADAFLQHQLSARLVFTLWSGGAGRLVLSIWDDVRLSSATELNAFGAALRFDLLGDRGLVDFAPDDAAFTSLLEHRCYAPMGAL